MKRFLLLTYFTFAFLTGYSQNEPVYGQYFNNQFLYNSGFAGAKMYPVLTLTHQRQFLGIEDAPVAYTLVFHTPIHKNIAIGAKIFSESQGLLTSSSGQFALVYVLPIKEKTQLRFGLAGGIMKTQLDLSSATESQLAFLSGISSSSNQLDIGFGAVLNSQRLKLGISFPNLNQINLVSYDNFQPLNLQPFEHIILTGSYKLDLVPTRLLLEPLLVYERFNSNQEQRIEGGALLHMKELIWVGGTYQHNARLSGLFGIKIKEHVSIGYAYGMMSTFADVVKHASHELQLKIKLGKTKEFQEKPRTHTPRYEFQDF